MSAGTHGTRVAQGTGIVVVAIDVAFALKVVNVLYLAGTTRINGEVQIVEEVQDVYGMLPLTEADYPINDFLEGIVEGTVHVFVSQGNCMVLASTIYC